MNKKAIAWIIGISLALIVICGVTVTVGVLISAGLRGDSSFAGGDAIALIRVEGTIQAGEPPTDIFGSSGGGAYSDRIVRQLKRANESDAVKAVVLRINSPGGGVVASDEIYEQLLVMDKPVLVSMGTLAASGGYYISAPTTEIWANRHTLTGSIGVIIQFIEISGFMEEYGLEANTITSGTNKASGSPFKTMTPAEAEIWQAIVDESYEVFVQIIAAGRGLDETTVRELADGRVYTGQQALDLGLVDQLGNLDDVIDRAAELAKIQGEPRIIEYDQPPSLFGGSLGQLAQLSPTDQLREFLNLNTGPIPMYLYTGQ